MAVSELDTPSRAAPPAARDGVGGAAGLGAPRSCWSACSPRCCVFGHLGALADAAGGRFWPRSARRLRADRRQPVAAQPALDLPAAPRETRIPIRDAYIGYFAGLSLLFAPFLLGEIAVRARDPSRRAAACRC